jgi:hypothetical protein
VDLDLFIGRDGIVKLLAESFGERKKGEWSTFIVCWDGVVGSGPDGDHLRRTSSAGSKVRRVYKKPSSVRRVPVVTETRA